MGRLHGPEGPWAGVERWPPLKSAHTYVLSARHGNQRGQRMGGEGPGVLPGEGAGQVPNGLQKQGIGSHEVWRLKEED